MIARSELPLNQVRRSGLGTAKCTAASEHSDLVPTGFGVVVLDGEHHHEDEEEPRGAEEVPEVVVVEDEEGALPVEVPGGGGRAGGGLELPGEEVAAEEEEGDGGGQVEPAEEGPSIVSHANFSHFWTPSPLSLSHSRNLSSCFGQPPAPSSV